ncbi:MAG: hypothetical protein M3Z75_08105 [Actinomycetota bacterium]|nr:hypothetical protein [Actinomycetota bacterium]
MKRTISKIFLVGAAAAAIAVPATAASASSGFAVQDNNGVLITSQHVFVGEVLTLHGHAERVVYVHPNANNFVFRVSPSLPGPNTTLPFAVVG